KSSRSGFDECNLGDDDEFFYYDFLTSSASNNNKCGNLGSTSESYVYFKT
ncbi:unnamed protein product, partial [Rotaria sp. Silwood2]